MIEDKTYNKYIKKFKNRSILDYLIKNEIIKDDYSDIIDDIVNDEISLINNKFDMPVKQCAIKALKSAYFCAKNGLVSAAFENDRFFLERLSLLKIMSCMDLNNNPYELALERKEWHELINNKFILYGSSQFVGRLNHYYGKNFDINKVSVYTTGVPLCGIHSKKFAMYSMDISKIEKETHIKINEKCSQCDRKATRFVVSLPKAGAIIGILGFYNNKDTRNIGKLYADYSRVLHPYGFYSYPKEYLINLWSLDLMRLFKTINKLIF